jgi:hypothetical protein
MNAMDPLGSDSSTGKNQHHASPYRDATTPARSGNTREPLNPTMAENLSVSQEDSQTQGIPRRPAQPGLTSRLEHRPQYLFRALCPDVLDASPKVRERVAADLKVIHIPELFSSKQEIFLGFGTPNMYITFPREDGTGYDKFAGKSLYRAPSVIEDTRNFVQSGVLIHLVNPPEELSRAIRDGASQHHGQKFRTCVSACCNALASAGVSVPGRQLRDITFPVDLLTTIRDSGLQFQGQQLKFQIIQTSPQSVEGYAFGIIRAELATFRRHFMRSLDSMSKKIGIPLFGPKRSHGLSVTKPASSPVLAENVDYASDISVSTSRTAPIGIPLRLLWGAHTIFEARQKRVSIDEYLPEKLKAFPQPNPSLTTRLKSTILFSRPVVAAIRQVLCPDFEPVGTRSEADIYEMLRTDSPDTPQRYNIVITDDALTISRIKIRSPFVDWVLTKHVLVSGYHDGVRFAGEIWKDTDGVLHLSRNSGTYRPSAEQLGKAVEFLRAVFPNLAIEREEREN